MYLLPGLDYTIRVRSKGVDAPELRSRCRDSDQKEAERILALEAAEAIERRFPVDSWVFIENAELGSFSGRIIADIKQRYGNQRWRTVTQALLEREGEWGIPSSVENFDWCEAAHSIVAARNLSQE